MRIATDIGGTFTDLVYVSEQGDMGVAKCATTPPNFEQGVMDVIAESGVHPSSIREFIHGTTVIINALTERKGVKTGLLTTKGFRDVMEIARGNRPDLFNVRYRKPDPFVPRYLRHEISERLNYKGEIVKELDINDIKKAVSYFQSEGVEAIAVVYLHSYVNEVHEVQTVQVIQSLWPEVAVTASHEVTKEWREYERANTAVLNSYVKPMAAAYMDRLLDRLQQSGTRGANYIMQSNGGITTFAQAKKTPIQMVESGPAAGVYGAAVLGQILGEENIIAFDIGGTTAKCSLIERGEVKVTTDYYIERTEKSAGYPIKVPVVDIVEIGNGGGSIAWVDEAKSLKVGPRSAGAFPGPVAYGLGGTEPTTTDANLIVGRLSARNFDYPVDLDKVRNAVLSRVANRFEMTVEEAALGIIRIADSNMLNALKLVSVRKGHDPRDFALIAFGGGGPMHAPILAKELGVKKVIIPIAASVFSAWGMLMTDLRRDLIQTYVKRVSDLDASDINQKWIELERQALNQYAVDGFTSSSLVFVRYANMRYVGQEHTVKVVVPSELWDPAAFSEIVERFHALHHKTYTFRLDEAPTEIVDLHLTAFARVSKPALKKLDKREGIDLRALLVNARIEHRPVFYEESGWLNTPVYSRKALCPGTLVEGPAIVEEKTTSTVLHPGQSLVVDDYGNLVIDTGVR